MRNQAKARRVRRAGVRFRFDPHPADLPVVECPERGVFARLHQRVHAGPRDRRRSARHEAAGFSVWIGWWRGRQEFFATPADLVNLSRGGALVQLDAPPPERGEVWFCISAAEPGDCVAATALDVSVVSRGIWSARLEFRAPCPHSFFEAAVC